MSPSEEMPLRGLHMLVWDDKPDELDRVLVAQADKTVLDAKHGHVPLIDAKYRGNTALGLAVQLGRRECIEVLLRHQADTLLASDSGYYPLQEAASFGDRDIIQSLLLRRHDQMRQLWKDLPDFFLEMDWHFKSWIPFLARWCPSDRCRIWKRGNRLRVDSTLVGVELEKRSWTRGNISYIFHVSDTDSRMYILNHDDHVVEEVDKMRDFTADEIEEDISSRLNTQIYSGKMRKPVNAQGEKRVSFDRKRAGPFGLGGEMEDQIGPYKTRVFEIPGVEVVTKFRREHLAARQRLKEQEQEQEEEDNGGEGDRKGPAGDESNPESMDSDKVLADLESTDPRVEDMIQEARDTMFNYVPSLPPPSNVPSCSREEYFSEDKPYKHVGRRMINSEKSKKFHATVWMADNFPLTIQQLLPFFEIMSIGNKNFEKVQDFVAEDLPPGFPVRIEIPIFAFLSAQITFLNFEFWSPQVPIPQFSALDVPEKDWFEIPSDYREGIVIKNILKNE